jgi:hypothetical protein
MRKINAFLWFDSEAEKLCEPIVLLIASGSLYVPMLIAVA